nr:TRAP transporter fused permease subunit [Pseudonocardia acaciae]
MAGYDEERPARSLSGRVETAVNVISALVAAFSLYQVFFPLPAGRQFALMLFLACVLPLVFLCYRSGAGQGRRGGADNPGPADWALAVVAVAVGLYPVLPVTIGDGGGGYNAFLDRQGLLTTPDLIAGAVLLVLVLEACRRTTGWVLPAACLLALAYSYYGGFLPQNWPIAHQGLNPDEIINGLYNDASGFYGVPLAVAASYIVLFALYAAVLDMSGAGRFFIELSFAMFGGSRTAPGRTVTLSGFLLGTVSGSGAATTVSLGSVTWPILRRAGYPAENAGGVLAAAGIGAILSPPTLGAAAFIIAEYLRVSYLQVLLWAILPTVLYYLGILLAVEIDARRYGTRAVAVRTAGGPWRLLGRFGYHLVSLVVIIVFLALDIPPFTAVVYAIGIQLVLSFLDKRHALTPRRLFDALAGGLRSALAVAAVCAAAGIITSTIAKTGLGLQLASILVNTARAVTDNPTGTLVVTAVLAALAIAVLGLAVPVTASFIIAWVIIAPALTDLGVAAPEAAMFIFYFAVLSEVTPPTALAAVAAAAITGGRVVATMWQAAKYTLPAFLVPFAFVLTDNGAALLTEGPAVTVLWASLVAGLAVAALAVVTGGWLVGRAGPIERALCLPAALLLLYLAPATIVAGVALLAAAVAVHLLLRVWNRETPEEAL